MAGRQDEEIPYRTPITALQKPQQVSSTNEGNYDTLVIVRDLFQSGVDGLYKEFNAFDVLKGGTDEEVKDQMMRQIAGNQIAYDILAPLLEAVNGAIKTIDEKYKQR